MNTQLIYLHIPKTAGTSFRALAIKNYPKDYFWWGVNEHTKHVDDCRFIGGHKAYSYYASQPSNKLFISLVRDPVARAISLFNYYINGPDEKERKRWFDLGINRDSFRLSVEQCKSFRDVISNDQCKYLCGKPSFDSVKSTIENENFVIGSLEHIDEFIDYMSNILEWPNNMLNSIDNRGAPNYDKSYYMDSDLIELIKSINKEDQKLYEYILAKRVHINILQDTLDLQSLKSTVKSVDPSLSRSACKKISLKLADDKLVPLSGLPNHMIDIPLSIHNESAELIPATGKYPVRASYHWYNADNELIEYEGIRTPLTENIYSGETLTLTLKVKLPAEQGEYRLKIGLLQEKCRWIEQYNQGHLLEIETMVSPLVVQV